VRVLAVARIRQALRARVRATGMVPEWGQQAAWAAARLRPPAVVPGAGRRSRGHCRSGWPHWSRMEDGVVVLGQRPAWGRRTIRWALADELASPKETPSLAARSPRVLVAQCQASPVSRMSLVRRANPVRRANHLAAVWRGLWPKLGRQVPSPGPGQPRPPPCPRKAAPAR
jgi:hypothetical protein